MGDLKFIRIISFFNKNCLNTIESHCSRFTISSVMVREEVGVFFVVYSYLAIFVETVLRFFVSLQTQLVHLQFFSVQL